MDKKVYFNEIIRELNDEAERYELKAKALHDECERLGFLGEVFTKRYEHLTFRQMKTAQHKEIAIRGAIDLLCEVFEYE